MPIFTTKDWSAGKTTKIRDAVQKKFNLALPATDAEISNYLDDVLRRDVRAKNIADNDAANAAANTAVADI